MLALEFKNNVKALRQAMNIPQVYLASMVGMHRETITRIENGKEVPSLKAAMDIASFFGKTVEEVFFFED